MQRRTSLLIAGVLLAIPIVLPLLVWTYAKEAPELAGIPFFYWYQFLLIIVAFILTATAYTFVPRRNKHRGGDR